MKCVCVVVYWSNHLNEVACFLYMCCTFFYLSELFIEQWHKYIFLKKNYWQQSLYDITNENFLGKKMLQV